MRGSRTVSASVGSSGCCGVGCGRMMRASVSRSVVRGARCFPVACLARVVGMARRYGLWGVVVRPVVGLFGLWRIGCLG